MAIRLDAIRFNHNPGSLSGDALNIRRNGTEFIEIPEWRRGVSSTPEQSMAAYAIKETASNPITILARFSLTSPAFQVKVRALELNSPPTNVLGEVAERTINFNFGLQSGFEAFQLQNTRLAQFGVGINNVAWRWQAKIPPDDWTDFATTNHKIYTLLEEPKSPWVQQPFSPDNLQLPWAEVLDFACRWASGAHAQDEVAELITRSINRLGPDVMEYDLAHGNSNYSMMDFECASFLELLKGGMGKGKFVNCSDCATFVSSFANILGCDLSQSRMGGSNFDVNPILLIGGNIWNPTGFLYHEVAWKGACTANDEVYDACLQIDADDDPTIAPQIAQLPINMRFGNTGEGLYRDRLARNTPAGRPKCDPQLNTRRRRKIKDPAAPVVNFLFGEPLNLVAQFHAFDSWRGFNALPVKMLIWRFFMREDEFPGWQLIEKSESRGLTEPLHTIQSLWTSARDGMAALLSVDVYECSAREAAHDMLLQLLGQMTVTTVAPLAGIGDVAFSVPTETMILFARANLVISVRDASEQLQPVRNLAARLDEWLIAVPDEPEPESLLAETALEFSAATPAASNMRLRVEGDALGEPSQWYKIFSPSGEVRLINRQPHYYPSTVEEHEVSVVTIESDYCTSRKRIQFSI